MKKKTKGTLFYTLIGLMVIALVAVISLHLLRTTYNPSKADDVRLQRFNDAIYGTQAEMQTLVRYSEYPAIWKEGHSIGPDGINTYLTDADGRKKLKEDLIKDLTENLNRELKARSLSNASTYYVLPAGDVNVTVSEIKQGDVSLNETDDGLLATVQAHMSSEYRDYKYDQTANVSSEVPARIFQMYDKAKLFHDGYARVQDYATALLYFRAYSNAYFFSRNSMCGPYLKEGYVSYDPIQTFLSGDLSALNDTKLPDDVTDVGAIPLALWLHEWSTAGEPDFLPPGYDMPTERTQAFGEAFRKASTDPDYERRMDGLRNLTKALTEMKAENVQREQGVSAWLDKSDGYSAQSCCEFKASTKPLLEEVIPWIGSGKDDSGTILDVGQANGASIDGIKNQMRQWDGLKTDFGADVSHLDAICSTECTGAGDCSCPKAEEGCDKPSCKKISCNSGDDFYDCLPIETGSRSEKVTCKDDEGKESKESVEVDVCACKCHPDVRFVENVSDDLTVLKGVLEKMGKDIDAMQSQVDGMLKDDQGLQDYKAEAGSISDIRGSGYDLVGNVEYNNVRYTQSFEANAYCNYYQPGKAEKNGGVCADWGESFTLYTAQIAAAATLAYYTGGPASPLASLINYAADSFPAVYDYEGNYTLSETIVDDKDRMMPHNLFAGDRDLYGYNITPKLYSHAPPEFVIYQNRPLTASSSTLGRLLLYLDIPELGFESIKNGIASDQCKGVSNGGQPCVYGNKCPET